MPRQDVSVELYYDSAWHDLVLDDDVLADTPIVIQRGDGDESAALRPSSITLRLANGHDKYRTSNPESPLYGKAGVNTPLRVSVAGVVRGIGEVSSWRCGQSRDFRRTPRRGKAWVDIEAGGLFQRINQWTDEIESTMVRGMRSFGDDLIGIWPLEDESSSTILSQLVPGGTSGTFTDATLGDSERPAGSASSVQLGSGGQISGTFIRSTASGWQISFAFRLPAVPGSASYEEIFSWTDSTGRRWTWELNNANFAWSVFDSDGTLLENLATSYSLAPPNGWVRVRTKATVSGGTITYEPAWYAEGASVISGTSGTFSGSSTGVLRTWTAVADSYNVGGWYTGVCGLDDASVDFFSSDITQGFNGHAGETAGYRFARLMGDLGLSYTLNGDEALSALMGGQPVATLAELLREIRDTDDAVLFESETAISGVLTLRNYRYNLDPALELDVDDRPTGLPGLPVEVTDDLPIHNIVTASQRDGGQYTAEDSTSPMGSAPPPDGRGEYRQTVDVNVFNEAGDLPQQAYWWLHRGTVDLPRFPQVTVNLAALGPAKVAEVEAATIGSVITITGYREYTIRLHVIGYTETIGMHSRTITFTCAPDRQFEVGEYDDGIARYDSASTTVKTAVTMTGTSIVFRTADSGELWSTTDTPYDVLIAGQRNRVTSMGAASLVSGAYDQTATVVRGVDGIRKPLAADEPIHVATPGRYAL